MNTFAPAVSAISPISLSITASNAPLACASCMARMLFRRLQDLMAGSRDRGGLRRTEERMTATPFV